MRLIRLARRGLFAVSACIAFATASAQEGNYQRPPPTQAPLPTGFAPLPPVSDEINDLQQQVNDLREELMGMKENASHGYLADPALVRLPSPEEQQDAFNKQFDKARGRYPSLQVNGVFQVDAGFFNQDAVNKATVGNAVDGVDFRRARLSAKGSVTETVNYMFQMDFAFFGRPTFTDVWLEQTELPVVGNFRIGQWKQPFSLEVVSSFRYTTFMERSLLFQTFAPFRHPGAGIYDHSEDLNWTWAASGFGTGQDQFGNSASNARGWGFCERVTHLPWYDEDSNGRGYLHVGAGHYYSAPQNFTNNFRTIPELFIGQSDSNANPNQQPVPFTVTGTPFFLQTGTLNIHQYNVVGAEALLVHGAFSWQTEAMVNFVDQRGAAPSVALPGCYSQVGWFLTGEHRPYDRKAGAIDRVMPFENFFHVATDGGTCTGLGAWEVAFRVSYLDFTPVDRIDPNTGVGFGGALIDYTVGVNWYWNPYTKLVFNAIHSDLQNPATGRSQSQSIAARAQIDF